MRTAPKGGWNPYLAGALSGLVSIASVWLSGKFLGTSTTFVRLAGQLEQLFLPEHVTANPYFRKIPPLVDWQWLLVAGIFLGSFLTARLFGDFRWQALPPMWKARFGPARWRRALVAFIGGVVAMFGARLADGCPSGHGLSGSLQLAVSGYVALICFFLGGLVVARLLYGGPKHD
jgi:uncharacterized membrane protein YedE/YeeE